MGVGGSRFIATWPSPRDNDRKLAGCLDVRLRVGQREVTAGGGCMGVGDSMRVGDRKIFARVAQGMGVWILMRGTNPASLEYICKKGYTPKPIDCKAKTAKKGPCAGLVVDPFKVADGFEDPSKVQEKWL